MVIAIPYHAGDIRLAAKVLRWMGFLSEKYGHYLKDKKVLLVPSIQASKRRLHEEMVALSSLIFGKSYTAVPDREDEKGWPQSCNFMFKTALEAVEESFRDDMFLLEPDAIPLTVNWFEQIEEEFAAEGKTFMGAFVAGSPHMTGIAVYGFGWRMIAPSLVTAKEAPWDLHSAPEVVPHCYFTSLIQHVNRREQFAKREFLDPRSVIFHQNKTGSLCHEIDREVFGGEWSRHPIYQDREEEIFMSTKYYRADNSNRRIKAGAFSFAFEPYGQHGGSWQGVYATDNEAHQIALAGVAGNPRNAVYEITAEEYERLSKKKVTPPNFSASGNWSAPSSPPPQPRTHLAGKGGAVVVENPSPLPDEPKAPPIIEKIEDVLKVATIKPVDVPQGERRRPGKAPKTKAA